MSEAQQKVHECPFAQDHDLVTKQECVAKHSSTKYVAGVIIALLAVFLGLLTFVGSAASQANQSSNSVIQNAIETEKKIDDVDKDLKIHCAQQAERDKRIMSSLDEIKEDVKGLQSEQKTLINAVNGDGL